MTNTQSGPTLFFKRALVGVVAFVIVFGSFFVTPTPAYGLVIENAVCTKYGSQYKCSGTYTNGDGNFTDQTFTTPPKLANGQNASVVDEKAYYKKGDSSPFNCGISSYFGFGQGSFGGCIGHVVYFLGFKLSTVFLGLAGWFFDLMAAFTLSTKVIDQPFVGQTWGVIRDMANMLFIFILLVIALATILQVDQYNAKSLLARLLIIAVVINFSLFASRLIIDAGNVTAHFFYKGITTASTLDKANASSNIKGSGSINVNDAFPNGAENALGYKIKEISATFTSFVKPQSVFDQKITKTLAESDPGTMIAFYIGMSIFFFLTGWAFFTVGLSFLTRVAVLWILMIFSPVAFAAMVLPSTKTYFDQWLKEITSKSFCVAIYLLFLYIIGVFVTNPLASNIFKSPSSVENAVLFLLLAMVYFSTLIVLLTVAKTTTVKMCDEFGGKSLNIGKKIAGFVGGAAGTLAMPFAGGAAARLLASDKVRSWASKGGVLRQFGIKGLEKTAGSTFGTGAIFGDKTKGGFSGMAARVQKSDQKYIEWLAKGEGGLDRKKAYSDKLEEKYKNRGLVKRLATGHWGEGGRMASEGLAKDVSNIRMKEEVKDLDKAFGVLEKDIKKLDSLIARTKGPQSDIYKIQKAQLEGQSAANREKRAELAEKTKEDIGKTVASAIEKGLGASKPETK